MTDVSLISVVDDDVSPRESLEGLLKSLGDDTAAFLPAESLLSSDELAKTACLILDVRMPGMSGLELQSELISRQRKIAIIFITAHGDKDVIARIMGDGAVDCLIKPFSEDSLLKTISRALPAWRALENDAERAAARSIHLNATSITDFLLKILISES